MYQNWRSSGVQKSGSRRRPEVRKTGSPEEQSSLLRLFIYSVNAESQLLGSAGSFGVCDIRDALFGQFVFQVFTGDTLAVAGDLLRRTFGNDSSATTSAIRAKVYHPVCTLDDVEVVLDDENGVAALYQCREGMKQTCDVVEVEARRRLIEDEERGFLLLLADEVGELDALVLTS